MVRWQERLERQLTQARQVSEELLADFHTPTDWLFQVHPQTNHALWFAGHMANTDNFFLSLVAPERALPGDDFHTLFGMGSRPSADLATYPPIDSVVERMRERRRTLLDVLHGLSDDDLARPTPDGAPDFLADLGSVFEMAIWHEGAHTGQLAILRRALGHAPRQ